MIGLESGTRSSVSPPVTSKPKQPPGPPMTLGIEATCSQQARAVRAQGSPHMMTEPGFAGASAADRLEADMTRTLLIVLALATTTPVLAATSAPVWTDDGGLRLADNVLGTW